MKSCITLIVILGCLCYPSFQKAFAQCYSSDYVEISNVTYNNDKYSVISMRRDGGRVKAKYFAAKDFAGRSVYQRYTIWKRTHPNTILVSSGTYMNEYKTPEGLTIDNGVVVNKNLVYGRMDALVIVYSNGGIAVSNLKEGNLIVKGGPAPDRALDLRKNALDVDSFINWAEDQEATVFQTHLLAYRNQLVFNKTNSSETPRERRFLAVGQDEDGNLFHVVIQYPKYTSLYDASARTLAFLQEFKELEIIFMVNLDTGAQDVFELYNGNCTVNSSIKGPKPLNKAVNLLVYHFQ